MSKHDNSASLGDKVPSAEQATAMEDLLQPNAAGLHVLSGPPGTGKNFCIQHLTKQAMQNGRKVMLCATTGAAAIRLSVTAKTVHSAFNINLTGMYMTPLSETCPGKHINVIRSQLSKKYYNVSLLRIKYNHFSTSLLLQSVVHLTLL